MNAVLFTARDPERVAHLAGVPAEYTASLDEAKARLAEGGVGILVLDCPPDDGGEADLLRFVEGRCPHVECIALVSPENFCRFSDVRSRNLYRMLTPVGLGELTAVIERTLDKLERMANGPATDDPFLLKRQDDLFWRHLLLGTLPNDAEGLLTASPPTSFDYKTGQKTLPVLICHRSWMQGHATQERGALRFAVKSLSEKRLISRFGGMTIKWQPDVLLLLLYGREPPGEDALRPPCEEITDTAAAYFDCNLAVYYGEPCLAHEMPPMVRTLMDGDFENVASERGVFSLRQVTVKREPFTMPAQRDWMPAFLNGRLDDFCGCMEEYFTQALTAGGVTRLFLFNFQQDFLQEIYFALKHAGLTSHDLFSTPEQAGEMAAATRSVPAMLGWTRQTADRAMTLMDNRPEDRSLTGRVRGYLDANLNRQISRRELSELLHLSEGHIARSFREETGLSISEYLSARRMDLARHMLEQTDIPPGIVAERSGYRDYAHFFRTFKKATGMSPQEYRQQNN